MIARHLLIFCLFDHDLFMLRRLFWGRQGRGVFPSEALLKYIAGKMQVENVPSFDLAPFGHSLRTLIYLAVFVNEWDT